MAKSEVLYIRIDPVLMNAIRQLAARHRWSLATASGFLLRHGLAELTPEDKAMLDRTFGVRDV